MKNIHNIFLKKFAIEFAYLMIYLMQKIVMVSSLISFNKEIIKVHIPLHENVTYFYT